MTIPEMAKQAKEDALRRQWHAQVRERGKVEWLEYTGHQKERLITETEADVIVRGVEKNYPEIEARKVKVEGT